MSEYSEKLKDPRWQKKRLKILERDKWTCQCCGDKKSTLVVHHRRYLPDLDPWDYSDELLVTLCESCHVDEREIRPDYERDLIEILKQNFFSDDIHILASAFMFTNPTLKSKNIAQIIISAIKSHGEKQEK